MQPPLVSVVIPTYNRAGPLQEAIDSVIAQDYPRLEILVVDDGSSDETATVMQTYASTVTALRQEHAGVSAARNHGVAKSRGEYIAFLDSDDVWLPGKISAQIALFRRCPQVQVCYTDEIWIRHGVRVNPKAIHRKQSGWMFFQSLALCLISPSSVMLRRTLWERLGGFDERLPACEDYDLWLRMCLKVPVHLIPQRLIVKRGGHADQLSRSVPVLDQYRIMALEKLLTGPMTGLQRRAVLDQLIQKCHIVSQGAHKRQHHERSQFYGAKERDYRQQLTALLTVAPPTR